jgi:serine/threonine protein kinase
VTQSPPELLAQHARGALTLEALQTQVRALANADVAQIQRWIGEIQAEVSAGRLAPLLAASVLETLTGASNRTQVLADPTVAQAQATLIRPSRAIDVDATEVQQAPQSIDADRTVASSSNADLTQRSAADLTERKADVTERKQLSSDDEATQRKVSSPSNHSPPDATVRIEKSGQTAARTLRAQQADAANMSSFPATRDAADRTEVIADRLVKSLDNVEDVHHGQLQPGAVIKKRFVLDSLIGKGGMGLVFAALDRRKEEAHDPSPRVALKVLNADFQRHPQSLIALQREARKAQTLAHPNVVTVFDFDRDGDAVYMTMELLKGRALEAFVKEGRGKGIKSAVALPIIRGIAEGLAYAHRKGIVHSDLKPGNVFVLEDGTPKILDFGIARAVPNATPDEAPDVFDAGMLGAYTEAYATDEMVEGVDPHPADDMYALGIIAYELLTGFHPYQRHSAPKARSLGVKPPPLKGLKLREARALERCLSFDRKHRPQNAAEFLKLFRGVTALQKALLAATVTLSVTAGYLSYENYRETGPVIPFSQLPAEKQQEFTTAMHDGDDEWAFYQRDGNPTQLMSAVERYADAYEVHPRNRDATKALTRVADAFLGAAGKDADARRVAANYLREQSDFYRRYAPVVEARE